MTKLFTTIFALAVSLVTAAAHSQDIKGDVQAGAAKNAMCIGCHGIKGYQASFPEVYKVPMISGQSAKYISAALHAYQKGERKHPSMRGIADSLNDQDIADLAAYYSQHGVTEAAPADRTAKTPSPAVAALLAKANCASCHGADFSKPIDPSYPKLGGQHADYLFVALKSYKMDAKNPKVGRSNAIMAGMAKQYSNAELKQLANYLSTVEGDLKVIPQSKFR